MKAMNKMKKSRKLSTSPTGHHEWAWTAANSSSKTSATFFIWSSRSSSLRSCTPALVRQAAHFDWPVLPWKLWLPRWGGRTHLGLRGQSHPRFAPTHVGMLPEMMDPKTLEITVSTPTPLAVSR